MYRECCTARSGRAAFSLPRYLQRRIRRHRCPRSADPEGQHIAGTFAAAAASGDLQSVASNAASRWSSSRSSCRCSSCCSSASRISVGSSRPASLPRRPRAMARRPRHWSGCARSRQPTPRSATRTTTTSTLSPRARRVARRACLPTPRSTQRPGPADPCRRRVPASTTGWIPPAAGTSHSRLLGRGARGLCRPRREHRPVDPASAGHTASHAVEVRVCYQFTTLLNLHVSLPMNAGLNLGDIWIERTRYFGATVRPARWRRAEAPGARAARPDPRRDRARAAAVPHGHLRHRGAGHRQSFTSRSSRTPVARRRAMPSSTARPRSARPSRTATPTPRSCLPQTATFAAMRRRTGGPS